MIFKILAGLHPDFRGRQHLNNLCVPILPGRLRNAPASHVGAGGQQLTDHFSVTLQRGHMQ